MLDVSRVRVEHDLYVLRHTSGLSLSLAGVLHELGAVIVNPYRVSAALRDKVIASRILQAAGVRTPDTYVASHPHQLLPLLDSGPLVIKPYQEQGAIMSASSGPLRNSRTWIVAVSPCLLNANTRTTAATARFTRSEAGSLASRRSFRAGRKQKNMGSPSRLRRSCVSLLRTAAVA